MMDPIRVGVVGDYNPEFRGHVTIAQAVVHAAEHTSLQASVEWISTKALSAKSVAPILGGFDGLMIAPGSPYENFDGALAAIEFGRTGPRPCFGSCAGFQHTLIEYARTVMGLADAHSAEYGVESKNIVVVPVSCPVPNRPADQPKLSGAMNCPENTIQILAGTKAAQIYQCEKAVEEYFCNYEANLDFQARFDAAGLRVTGVGPRGESRIVEIPEHMWFLATLFQPQRATAPGKPHPLFVDYLRAAAKCKRASARQSGMQHARSEKTLVN